MHIPIPKKLQPPVCQPLAAMRVPFLQALARRANARGSAQPVLLPTDTAEVDEVRRVVDALAEITKPDAASLERKIRALFERENNREWRDAIEAVAAVNELEGAMTVTAPFIRIADIDRAQAVSIGDIAIERGFVLKKTGPELVGSCPHCGGHDRPARPMARSAAVTSAVMKRAIRGLNVTSNDTGQERSTKYERLGELLRKYGLDLINSEQFWAEMKRQGFGQADIDEWCDEYHRKTEAEKRKIPTEQHLEVIEDAVRMAKTAAAAIKRDRRIKGEAIPLTPSRFNRLREAMAALAWRESATREDEIGLRMYRCASGAPIPICRCHRDRSGKRIHLEGAVRCFVPPNQQGIRQ